MEEIWKDKKDYEGLYQTSNLGRVKSFKFGKERILKPGTDKNGYLLVNLCKNGKVKTFKVHRLVAEAFLPNPDNLPEVNHKDENKQNNVVSNLEWCDRKYNINYGTGVRRSYLQRCKPVLQYDLEGNFVREWKSIRECGRNGYDQGNVTSCCRGKQKTHKGFIWKYK